MQTRPIHIKHPGNNQTVHIVLFCPPEDFRSLQRLLFHLAPLAHQGVQIWHPLNILAGEDFDAWQQQALGSAHLFLPMISAGFLANDDCQALLKAALDRHKKGQCRVIPLLLRECAWENLGGLQTLTPLPRNNKPIMSAYWRNRRDEVLTQIVVSLLEVVTLYREQADFINHPLPVLSEEEQFQTDLEKLRAERHHLPIELILKGNPFDHLLNFNGLLTTTIFLRKLLADQHLSAAMEAFRRLLNDPAKSIIFLSGYPGIGKTTFLHSFQYKYSEEFDHLYFDVQKIRQNLKNSDGDGREMHHNHHQQVLQLFQSEMLDFSDEQCNILETFQYLYDQCQYLYHGNFISPEFAAYLQQHDPEAFGQALNPAFVEQTMRQPWFGFLDTFTVFFANLFLQNRPGIHHVVYFDNLDILEMEYITETFMETFINAYHNAAALAASPLFQHKNIWFTTDYKFVFSFREANDARVKSIHILSRLRQEIVRFPLQFQAGYFTDILRRRLELIQDIFPPNEIEANHRLSLQDIERWMTLLTEDHYFKHIFLPVFNYDYRKSVAFVLEIIQKCAEYSPKFRNDPPRFLNYGHRGILLYCLLDRLREMDFISKYPDIKAANIPKGYCSLDRMMLTVLLNNCQYLPLEDKLYKDQLNIREACPLDKLVQVMQPVVRDEKKILKSIARCFLYHQRDWVNLVTVLNWEVASKDTFVNELMQDRKAWHHVRIKVNDSAFAFVKYLLPHFEYFGIIVRNNRPLFMEDLNQKIVDQRVVYAFEYPIDRVFDMVQKHILAMMNYYRVECALDNGGPFKTPKEYRTSDFCFRHLGKRGYQVDEGYFHCTRIITSHIDYIDRFRTNLFQRHPHLKPSQIAEINERLIHRIQKYLDLMMLTIDDRAIQQLHPHFQERVNQILFDRTNTELCIEIPKELNYFE